MHSARLIYGLSVAEILPELTKKITRIGNQNIDFYCQTAGNGRKMPNSGLLVVIACLAALCVLTSKIEWTRHPEKGSCIRVRVGGVAQW